MILLLITATFLCCFVVTSSSKGINYSLKSFNFKTQRTAKFITFRPLVVPSLHLGTTADGLGVINSIDPWVLKSNYLVLLIFSCNFACSLVNQTDQFVYQATDNCLAIHINGFLLVLFRDLSSNCTLIS